MGKVTITDEAGTPVTPADGLTLYAVAGVLYYRDADGTVHMISDAPGGTLATDQQLISWTESAAYELTAITYHGTYTTVVATATAKWPDGSAGTWTATTIDATWEAVNAYTISHTLSGKTVTQAAVTRNADGNITAKPALTVA